MRIRPTRGAIVAAAAAAVFIAAAAVLSAWLVPRWWRGDGGSYAPKRVLVRTSVSPSRSLFGQVLTATLRVVVDPRRVDPGSIDVAGSFRPFSVRSEADDRGRIGRAAVLTFRFELQCLEPACVPRGGTGRARAGATAFSFPPALVTGRRVGGRPLRLHAAWPAFGVQSRLTPADLALAQPRAENPLVAPPVTWRVDPTLLAGAASIVAVLLVLGAGALVVRVALLDRRPLRALRIPPHLTPIDRALALAEHAARHGEVDESRKALERLAAELRRHGAVERAGDAERLAWSARSPTPESVETLADAVRSNGAR